MSELSGWMLLMASKSPAMTLCPPGAGPPERITPTRIGEAAAVAEPFSKVTAGRSKVFGKRARISLSLDVGNGVCFAVDAALSEAGSLGRYAERAWASAVCWIMECDKGRRFFSFPENERKRGLYSEADGVSCGAGVLKGSGEGDGLGVGEGVGVGHGGTRFGHSCNGTVRPPSSSAS